MKTPEQWSDEWWRDTRVPFTKFVAAIQSDAREGMVSRSDISGIVDAAIIEARRKLHEAEQELERRKESMVPRGELEAAEQHVTILRKQIEDMVPVAELRPTIELLKHWPASHTAAHNELTRLEALLGEKGAK